MTIEQKAAEARRRDIALYVERMLRQWKATHAHPETVRLVGALLEDIRVFPLPVSQSPTITHGVRTE